MRRLILIVLLAMRAGFTSAGDAQSPEFDGYCAYSLAAGAEMKTGCEVVWIAPDDKLYCFLNEAAKAAFIKDAPRSLRKARAFWEDPAYWEKLKAAEES